MVSVDTFSVQLLSLNEISCLGPLWTSFPLWYHEMVKGGEPETLHSISAACPTTALHSFSFLENDGGIVLSARDGGKV